ncbi:acyl-CoA N-acyltransferase [Multifurca ochricompacta]|uniref:Histone acetyltransferase n=1 Tax=Multifurca ochricompacta TaxID=376703 RepID=A0AAD4LW67_9AGAM|nr:acyl-CoA N-acyltransferase [Multifurca ochricompacta]
MVVRLRLPAQGKGKEKEDSSDEEPAKGLFDDILTPEDRDTSKTVIMHSDKVRFERSRQATELNPPQPKPTSIAPEIPIAGPSNRPLRSNVTIAATQPSNSARSVSPTPSTPGPSPATAHSTGLRIRTIRFGEYDIQTWYDAPFPEEYANIPDGRLWICEFCLKYNKSRFGASRHGLKCKARHPPGDEIYRDGSVSIFEVDGRRNKIYCQNLCLLSRMFLDHKSLFYDVEPFLFYVMAEIDDSGARFVGYFSKEKRSPKDFNVSCIMTLPVRQRQGWGNLLIEFSYLLSKKEQRLGSPEKPLSGLGALGYKNYWTLSIMRYLHTSPDNPTLEDISNATSMTIEDVYNTLCTQGLIDVLAVPTPKPLPGQSIKLTKNRKTMVARRHLIRSQTNDDDAIKGPFVPPTQYEIHCDPGYVKSYLDTWEAKGYMRIKSEKLKWSPFLLARVKKSDADSGLAPDAEVISGTPDKDNLGPASTSSVPETPAPVTPVDADGDNDETFSTPVPHSQEKHIHSPEPTTLRRLRGQRRTANDNIDSGSTFTPSRFLRGPGVSGSPPNGMPSPSSTSVSPSKPQRIPKAHERGNPKPIKHADSSSMKEAQIPALVHDGVDEDADAALAARLAEEESRPKRLLRSRSGTGTLSAFELPLLPSRPTTTRPPPRKRRRVESPATDELPSAPEPLRELGVINGVTRGEEDMRSDVDDTDTPYTVVTSRHSAPSDDTVVVVVAATVSDGSAIIKDDTNSPVVINSHAMDVDESPVAVATISSEDLGADVDADGETDADAEGEDDDDLDAEGEPDDGL